MQLFLHRLTTRRMMRNIKSDAHSPAQCDRVPELLIYGARMFHVWHGKSLPDPGYVSIVLIIHASVHPLSPADRRTCSWTLRYINADRRSRTVPARSPLPWVMCVHRSNTCIDVYIPAMVVFQNFILVLPVRAKCIYQGSVKLYVSILVVTVVD